MMTINSIKNIITAFAFFILIPGNIYAQKIYYAPENKTVIPKITEKSSDLIYTVYTIGDLRSDSVGLSNLRLLKKYIDAEQSPSAVILPGDILYPSGLPDSSDNHFSEAENNLKHILNTFKNYKGKIFMLPGNHDWAKGRKQGLQSVENEEAYIEQYLKKGNVYYPDNACSGPQEINLSEDITLIIFDSQQWFQKSANLSASEDCRLSSGADLYIRIDDILKRNQNKKIIFATHHPLYSVGKHGGYFPASDYLFPLRNLNKYLYIPLPGIIYTGYRKYLGSIQDLAHPEYKEFRRILLSVFEKYPNIIYVAGHEHNLQYFDKDSLHHIISGSGGKSSYIAKKSKKTDFAYAGTGFGKLSFYKNGNVWAEFIAHEEDTKGKIIFRKKIFNKPVFYPELQKKRLQNIHFSDSTVKAKASDLYNVGKFHRFMLGDNYRNVWNAEVELPVFDIGTEKGGLTIIKRGGGKQTMSIRMKDKNGKQYVLRSINKNIEKVLPPDFRNTFAEDILQDGVSASNPFGAVTVPPLADAAGVMHTNPKLVWIPDDPRLGIYQKDMANQIFLYEERPAGNRDDVASFGYSKKIINTAKVIKKTHKDSYHQIDQKSVLRARVFDILLNDWDRHDDQWRWASFKNKKNTVYRPIPRDRDQAYFVNEGLAMKLIKQKWLVRRFQGFNDTLKDVEGLAFNARYFDRSFISEPVLKDWKKIAEDIKNKVNDSVIHKAVLKMPENIYNSVGNFTEEKLKYRREYLPEYAERLYRFLAKAVDVVGTNKNELFKINRKENGNTSVTVYALHKNKEKKKIYNREFKPEETKEIRLYGLKGKDSFIISGTGKKGIKIRIIGGKGKDTFIDSSHVKGLSKKTLIYDRKDKKNTIVKGKETRLLLSKKKSVNTYDRLQFKYNMTIPLLSFGYKIDDGMYIGGGAKIKRYNFRDSTVQKITGNIAFKTSAFSLKYDGLFTSVSPLFDLTVKAELNFPRNVNNFYGLGNETEKISDSESYYRLRYQHILFNPMLKQTIGNKFNYAFGIFYQYYNLTDTVGRFIGDIASQLPPSVFQEHHYTGINAEYTINTEDNKVMPKRGMYWKSEILGYYALKSGDENFAKIRSDLRFFVSFRKDPRVVFAFRFGGATNIGNYDLWQANSLGGKTNLRGFRADRFSGDAVLYQNSEIRFKLKNIRNYLFNGEIGFFAFYDIGKVWYNNENSNILHKGYGAGIWIIPFNFTTLTLNYNQSEEDSFINFGFKYSF